MGLSKDDKKNLAMREKRDFEEAAKAFKEKETAIFEATDRAFTKKLLTAALGLAEEPKLASYTLKDFVQYEKDIENDQYVVRIPFYLKGFLPFFMPWDSFETYGPKVKDPSLPPLFTYVIPRRHFLLFQEVLWEEIGWQKDCEYQQVFLRGPTEPVYFRRTMHLSNVRAIWCGPLLIAYSIALDERRYMTRVWPGLIGPAIETPPSRRWGRYVSLDDEYLYAGAALYCWLPITGDISIKKTMQAKGWKLYDSEDIARIYETQDTTTKEKENGIQTSKING